jgi:hypothetical protein
VGYGSYIEAIGHFLYVKFKAMSQEFDCPQYKPAAVQAGPIFGDSPQDFDFKATLEQTVGLIEEAGKEEARLIVFPECWLPCFPCWSLELIAGRAIFANMWARLLWSSIELSSPETEVLGCEPQAILCRPFGAPEK